MKILHSDGRRLQPSPGRPLPPGWFLLPRGDDDATPDAVVTDARTLDAIRRKGMGRYRRGPRR